MEFLFGIVILVLDIWAIFSVFGSSASTLSKVLWIVGIIVFLIWIPAIIFSGGLTHPMFVLLAWFLIHQSAVTRDR